MKKGELEKLVDSYIYPEIYIESAELGKINWQVENEGYISSTKPIEIRLAINGIMRLAIVTVVGLD